MKRLLHLWCRMAHWRSMRLATRPFVRREKDLGSWQDRIQCSRCKRTHWLQNRAWEGER